MKPLTRPLFQFDAGWLFVAAGLAVCAAGVLIPAQNDLDALQSQFRQLQSEEARAYARLKAHADFMDQVDRADPALTRRLAAAQLNMVPEGDVPILLASSKSAPVTYWIESTIDSDIRPAKPPPISTLSRWVDGPHRLYFFGAGIMAVFVGVVLSPSLTRRTRVFAFEDHVLHFAGAEQFVEDESDLIAPVAEPNAAPSIPTVESLCVVDDLYSEAHQAQADTDAELPAAQAAIVETQTALLDLHELRTELKGGSLIDAHGEDHLCHEVDELGLEIVADSTIEPEDTASPDMRETIESEGFVAPDSVDFENSRTRRFCEPAD